MQSGGPEGRVGPSSAYPGDPGDLGGMADGEAGQVTEARRRLAGYLENPHGHRDALMLDVAMDAWFKLSIEKTDFGKLSGDDLLEVPHTNTDKDKHTIHEHTNSHARARCRNQCAPRPEVW